jgi:ATP-dependent DNA helicase RecG
VTATFFNPRYLKQSLVEGTRVMLSGEVGFFQGTVQLTHPAFLVLDSPRGRAGAGSPSLKKMIAANSDGGDDGAELDMSIFERDYFPIYPASARLQSWDIYACVRQVLSVLDPVPDPFPKSLVREYDLLSEDESLRAVHLTESPVERERALERLRFDEAIGLQWALAERRFGELSETGPPAGARAGGLSSALLGRLPFELTAGQRDVLEVISAELSESRPMNRMLQGEVGSGKTVVALLAMLQMVDAGYQCAMLAPTEVLADQHARSIRDGLGPLAMAGQLGGAENATRIALLTGSMSAALKKQVRAEIASGEAGIVIGTHALLQDAVEFHQLGMVVVDEQHRFGVEQRDQLRAKARDGVTPHLLVMTATPIPRTVALTVYGDLETSTLRELPRGRQPISTSVVFATEKPKWLDRAWQRIREEVAAGRQAYVVAPRIDDEDQPIARSSDDGPPRKATAVLDLYDRLRGGEFAGLRVGLMHGKLSADEKDAVMAGFRTGDIDVLVCTTVIEVGVDVPNATVMVVIDADWFGISQLHQLRGRIGRGQHPSLCLLVTRLPESSKAGTRLNAVASTLDGFTLADLDLAERREGDVLGRNQSGRSVGLRLLSLGEHREIIEAAREFCDDTYPQDRDNAGLAVLAAHFTGSERIEYLDKS